MFILWFFIGWFVCGYIAARWWSWDSVGHANLNECITLTFIGYVGLLLCICFAIGDYLTFRPKWKLLKKFFGIK